MSLSVEALQEVKLAPKRDARVRPPVDEALVKLRDVALSADDVALVKVALVIVPDAEVRSATLPFDIVVVASVEAPATFNDPVKLAVEDIV